MILPHWLHIIRFQSILALSTLVYFSAALVMLLFKKKPDDVTYWVAHQWGELNLRNAGTLLSVTGKEHLSKTPAIFVCNHQSVLDTFIMCVLSPHRSRPVAKKSFRYYPVMGTFLNAVGTVFLDRFHRKQALEGMNQAQQLAKKGYSMLMAPEGTRTLTGELLPLKKGAFYLALQTKLPMIPITIVGAFDLYPKPAWGPKPGKVDIYIDAPIDTSQWTEESIPHAVEQVRNIFLSHL